MVKLNAHFDGKVIIPDEPLALKPNQRIRVSIEPIGGDVESHRERIQSLRGIAKDGAAHLHDPGAHEDAYWEKGMLPRVSRNDQ